MSEVTAKMWLEMWLSEQIPTLEWQKILEERPDVKVLYDKYQNLYGRQNTEGEVE